MVATTLPTLQDDDSSITTIQAKINQIESNLNAKQTMSTQRKNQLLLDLNQEHEKLFQIRKDQCDSLVDQWQSYQQAQKDGRQSEISKRQIEFDKQLDLLDEEKRKGWIPHQQDQSVLCNRLLAYLQKQQHQSGILTFPPDILDLFWSVKMQVPVLETELPLIIETLMEMSKKH